MATLFQPSLQRATDDNGDPINGAKMYFYEAGSTTPLAYYTDADGTTEGTNPLVSDADGIFAPAFLGGVTHYRVVLKNNSGSVTYWDVDDITGSGSEPLPSVKDYGVVGDGVTDDTAAIAAITDWPAAFPAGTYKLTADVAGLGKQFVGFGGVDFTGSYRVQTSTAYGIGALANNVGFNTGSPDLTDKNAAFGTRALFNNTTGYHNTAIGDEALYTNTTGRQNTAIGLNTLYYNTGNSNTAVGVSAMRNNTSGADNVAVGRAAAFDLVTGDFNVHIGRDNAAGKTSGDKDTFVGAEIAWQTSGTTYAGGGHNTAVGFRANYSMTTGTQNVAIGESAGQTLISASYTVFIGYRAGFANTASDTVAVGYQAAYSQTSAARTTALGYRAGFTNVTGGDTVAIGWQAGYLNTNSQCTFIGSQCAPSSTGQYNTIIGCTAGTNTTTGGAQTLIGYGAEAPAATTDNCIAVKGGTTLIQLAGGLQIISGSGTPEGAITAPVGSLYLRTNGGAGTSLYVKESGTGNTGWIGK